MFYIIGAFACALALTLLETGNNSEEHEEEETDDE